MTKEEAIERLSANLYKPVNELDKLRAIRDIIDQIDQPPGEFSVRELCKLIAATHDNYPDLHVELFGDGSWICGKFDDEHFDSLRAKLLELAKPPMPETLCVELPTSTIVAIAAGRECEVQAACKAALEKAGVKR